MIFPRPVCKIVSYQFGKFSSLFGHFFLKRLAIVENILGIDPLLECLFLLVKSGVEELIQNRTIVDSFPAELVFYFKELVAAIMGVFADTIATDFIVIAGLAFVKRSHY